MGVIGRNAAERPSCQGFAQRCPQLDTAFGMGTTDIAELMNRVCGPSQYYQKANPFPHSSDVGTRRRFNH